MGVARSADGGVGKALTKSFGMVATNHAALAARVSTMRRFRTVFPSERVSMRVGFARLQSVFRALRARREFVARREAGRKLVAVAHGFVARVKRPCGMCERPTKLSHMVAARARAGPGKDSKVCRHRICIACVRSRVVAVGERACDAQCPECQPHVRVPLIRSESVADCVAPDVYAGYRRKMMAVFAEATRDIVDKAKGGSAASDRTMALAMALSDRGFGVAVEAHYVPVDAGSMVNSRVYYENGSTEVIIMEGPVGVSRRLGPTGVSLGQLGDPDSDVSGQSQDRIRVVTAQEELVVDVPVTVAGEAQRGGSAADGEQPARRRVLGVYITDGQAAGIQWPQARRLIRERAAGRIIRCARKWLAVPVTCGICCDDVYRVERRVLVSGSNKCASHERYCKACNLRYVKGAVEEGVVKIRCSHPGCAAEMTDEDVAVYVPGSSLSKRRALEVACRKRHIVTMHCEAEQSRASADIREVVKMVNSNKDFRVCPNCYAVIYRYEGCDDMACACKRRFNFGRDHFTLEQTALRLISEGVTPLPIQPLPTVTPVSLVPVPLLRPPPVALRRTASGAA